MRTLSFENLRRLVGRRKDREPEPSFERSESFKRISIRKSYLDRAKRRTRLSSSSSSSQQKPTSNDNQSVDASSVVSVGPTIVQVLTNDEEKKRPIIEEDTIVYGQWLSEVDSSGKADSYLYDSRVFSKRNYALPRKINNDERKVSSVLIKLDKSPQLPRSRKTDELVGIIAKECNCVTTVNISNDEPATPLSPPPPVPVFDDKRIVVAKVALSEPEKTSIVGKTDTSSTRASGFSLSLSISRLTTDIKKNGLFRRRKLVKPAPSVSAEGYFERTAAAATTVAINNSTRRSRRSAAGSSARRRPVVYGSRRRKITTTSTTITTTTATATDKANGANGVPASPVWFVPPERRRSNRQRGRVWREVRYLPQENDVAENNDEHGSNSDEFDDKKLLLSGDFDESKPETTVTATKKDASDSGGSTTLDSSSLISTLASCSSLKPKISDFNEDKIFYEEYRGVKSRSVKPLERNYFASSQFLGFVAGAAAAAVACTSSSSSSESTDNNEQRRVLLVVEPQDEKKKKKKTVVLVLGGKPNKKPEPRRRPLRRKSQLKNNASAATAAAAVAAASVNRQPVYLARRRSSLRRRPTSKSCEAAAATAAH